MSRFPITRFVANGDDDLHCLQATHAMVVEALSGDLIDMAAAEAETGFREGMPTWPFEAFLALAERGFYVIDDELFDIDHFLADPKGALLGQNADEDVTANFMATLTESDMKSAAACRRSDRIFFTKSSPNLEDLFEVCRLGGVAMAQINSSRLAGREGYLSHIVVLDADVSSGTIIVQDPGLPPRPDWRVSRDDFVDAWLDPSEEMANLWIVLPTSTALDEYMQLVVERGRSEGIE